MLQIQSAPFAGCAPSENCVIEKYSKEGVRLMNQQWLSVIGLTLDITGAFIVIREWWLGHTQTLRESAQNQSVKVLLEAIADQNREKPYTVSQALEQIANTGIEIDIIVKIRPLLIKTGATL